jgi:hypothetical protein
MDLLDDIELIASRADKARRVPQEHAAAIVEAAEATHLRVLAEWRRSRGGNANNAFFGPLSKRLRRIIAWYRRYREPESKPAAVEGERWGYSIRDYELIPFDRLKPYFRASHVDQAIKAGISLGMRDLPGVLIYQDETEPE